MLHKMMEHLWYCVYGCFPSAFNLGGRLEVEAWRPTLLNICKCVRFLLNFSSSGTTLTKCFIEKKNLAANQERVVLDHKNTRISEAQLSFLLCLNISCILSTVWLCSGTWLLAVTHWVECFTSVGPDRFAELTSSPFICLLYRCHKQKHYGCLQTGQPNGGTELLQNFPCSLLGSRWPFGLSRLQPGGRALSLWSPRCQVAHILLNLDAMLCYRWILVPRRLRVGWEGSIVFGVWSS